MKTKRSTKKDSVLALCITFGLLFSLSTSATGIRVHKAGQFKKDREREMETYSERYSPYHTYQRNLARSQQKHRLRYHSRNANRPPRQPDSRFPNSYREYSNYQKRQNRNSSRRHRYHRR